MFGARFKRKGCGGRVLYKQCLTDRVTNRDIGNWRDRRVLRDARGQTAEEQGEAKQMVNAEFHDKEISSTSRRQILGSFVRGSSGATFCATMSATSCSAAAREAFSNPSVRSAALMVAGSGS